MTSKPDGLVDGFGDWLAHHATMSPARLALVAGGRSWTYAELDAAATSLARQLAHGGIVAGDRVATLLHNGPVPAIVVHAVLRLGATLVPLNVRLSDLEIAWQLRDANARLLMIEERTVAASQRARDEHRDVVTLCIDAAAATQTGGMMLDLVPEAQIAPRLVHAADDVLAIIYTSGTTGQPKGVMLTVGNFWWSAVGSALNLGLQRDDRWLACLPLFHVGGLSIVLRAAIYGTCAVVQNGFDVDAVNHAIDDGGITLVSVVAVMLQRMLDARRDAPFPSSLRGVLLGGGPAPGTLLDRCALLGVPVVQTYGLTESCSQLATLAPRESPEHRGSSGRVLYPNELRIARPDDTAAAANEPGEIVARGPVVMLGYAGREDATARALAGGWLRTGDIGYMDAGGYLFVLDRRDDLIVTGGENVYPAEVESALLAHPMVADAGVVGLADDTWGQRVVAVVQLRDGYAAGSAQQSTDALREHCRTLLGGYKVPREIRVVHEPLPRTASGKLRRAELRARTADLPAPR